MDDKSRERMDAMSFAHTTVLVVLQAMKNHGIDKVIEDLRDACMDRRLDCEPDKAYDGLLEMLRDHKKIFDNKGW